MQDRLTKNVKDLLWLHAWDKKGGSDPLSALSDLQVATPCTAEALDGIPLTPCAAALPWGYLDRIDRACSPESIELVVPLNHVVVLHQGLAVEQHWQTILVCCISRLNQLELTSYRGCNYGVLASAIHLMGTCTFTKRSTKHEHQTRNSCCCLSARTSTA